MRKNLFLAAIILFSALLSFSVSAQNTAVKPILVSGDVVSITAEKIVLKTASGDIDAVLSDKTQYFTVPPENPTLKAAVAANFSEIGVGDKVVVTGIPSEDKKTLPARNVYLMSKSAISQRQQKERDEWRTRGTVGKVVNFNPQTSVITIATRSLGAEKTISVKPKDNAEYYRYAPDSIEFSKAQKSKISDIEPNDEIRVLGDKNADGSEIQAEKIITGGFKTSGGTIKAIDVAKNEVIITDFQTKKDVAIAISDFSILKQFPAEIAQRMAMMQAAGGQGGMRPPQGGGTGQTTPQQPQQQQQNQQTPGQTPGGAGQGGLRAAGGGIDDSRFQNIKISDLKVGEMVGVLSSKNTDPNRVRAIKLFSGVEPFIRMSQAAAQGGGGGGRQGGGGGGASLTIPGLDGFGGN